MVSQNLQNLKNICVATAQPCVAGKQPVGVLSQPRKPVLTVLFVL
jgi:hypothetical protein